MFGRKKNELVIMPSSVTPSITTLENEKVVAKASSHKVSIAEIVRTKPDSYFLDHLNAVYAKLDIDVKYLNQLSHADRATHKQVVNGFYAVKDAIMKVDRKNLTDSEAEAFADNLYLVGVMPVINHYVSHVYSNEMEKAYHGDIARIDGKSGTWSPVEQQISYYLRDIHALYDKALLRGQANKGADSGVPENPFMIEIKDSALRERLEAIKELWIALVNEPNSDDDSHFLEEIRNSYLPNALNLYAKFKNANAAQLEKANVVLGEQFKAIEEHLERIQNDQLEQTLTQMKLHANFLKARTESVTSNAPKGIDFAMMES